MHSHSLVNKMWTQNEPTSLTSFVVERKQGVLLYNYHLTLDFPNHHRFFFFLFFSYLSFPFLSFLVITIYQHVLFFRWTSTSRSSLHHPTTLSTFPACPVSHLQSVAPVQEALPRPGTARRFLPLRTPRRWARTRRERLDMGRGYGVDLSQMAVAA